MKIGGKQFLNIQEAVGWLLANNALPFQSTSNFVADTEIAKSTIINPSPAEIRVGALVLFADRKVGTVSGITSNGFMVGADYTDFTGAVYITSIQINQYGHLIFSLSDGTTKDAGLIKQIQDLSLAPNGHLFAFYNDGSSEDLGGLFDTNISINGNLAVSGDTTLSGHFETPDIRVSGSADFDGGISVNDGDVDIADNVAIDGTLDVGGDVALSGGISVTGTTDLTGDVITAGKVTVGGDLDVSGDTEINGNLTVISDAKIFENIVDKDGHKRFIEGDVSLNSITGLTKNYGKWSLSGTHLMIVLAGKLDNATVLSAQTIAHVILPDWIFNKIIPVAPNSGRLERKSVVFYADNASSSQSINVNLGKTSTDLVIDFDAITATADRYFRLVFDLLIDNE